VKDAKFRIHLREKEVVNEVEKKRGDEKALVVTRGEDISPSATRFEKHT
jgi:hypothetical protein